MGVLSNISSSEAIKAFGRLGWIQSHQTGSHIILKKDGHPANLSVPNRRECAQGTLRHLIKVAGLTVDEFIDLL